MFPMQRGGISRISSGNVRHRALNVTKIFQVEVARSGALGSEVNECLRLGRVFRRASNVSPVFAFQRRCLSTKSSVCKEATQVDEGSVPVGADADGQLPIADLWTHFHLPQTLAETFSDLGTFFTPGPEVSSFIINALAGEFISGVLH